MAKKILRWLDVNFEPIVVLALIIVMVSLIALQVVLRFFFKIGINWIEEITRYFFVWLVVFSTSYGARNNRHIRFNFLLTLLSDKGKRIVMLVSDALFFVFSATMIYYSYKLCEIIAKYGDRAVAIDISLNILYLAGLFGFILCSTRLMQCLWWKIKHFKDDIEIFETLYSNEPEMQNIVFGLLKSY